MEYLVGVLIIVVGLLLSIALHEVGHLVPAQRFGVRVPQYMVGFGPTLWSWTRGETEYGIKAIPLGGYVRLVGMYPPQSRPVRGPRVVRELISSAREASLEEIRPGEEHRAFYRLSTPKKIVIMVGGPAMNLVIAAVMFTVVVLAFGVSQPSTQLADISQCVVPVTSESRTECLDEDPPAPAAAAGLQPGDTVVAIGTTKVTTWDELSAAIAQAGGETVALSYERDGELVTTSVTPLVTERPVTDRFGVPQYDDQGQLRTEPRGFLGVAPAYITVHQPLTQVPHMLGQSFAGTFDVILSLPQRMVDVWHAAFGGEERGLDSPVGVVGVGRIAGDITSADQLDGELAAQTQQLLLLIGSLNVALCAFNLIPLPPLDGGHVAGALYEGARRSVARLRGRRDPGNADTARLLPLAYGVFVLLAGMGLLLIYADLVNPVRLIQ